MSQSIFRCVLPVNELSSFNYAGGKCTVVKTLPAYCCKCQSSYNAKEQREILSEIRGGSVDLFKDGSSGIATVVINHEKRKNAFSGKLIQGNRLMMCFFLSIGTKSTTTRRTFTGIYL